MERRKSSENGNFKQEYLGTLATVRDRYIADGLSPLFVGGIIAKAVNLETIEQMRFNHAERTVHIPIDSQEYTAPRSDGTFDDFDIIVNHPDKAHVDGSIADAAYLSKLQGYTHHFVSTEAVRYPKWKKRSKLRQMVSGIDVDDEGNTRSTFGDTVSDPIHPDTLQPWNYVFEENGQEVITLPSFNPAFFGLRYVMRLPVAHSGGLRAKDAVVKPDPRTGVKTTKLGTLMKMRVRALATGVEQGYSYDGEAWRNFIRDLQHPVHQDELTRFKSDLMHFWWHDLGTLATAMVHGKGIFGAAAKTGDKFGG